MYVGWVGFRLHPAMAGNSNGFPAIHMSINQPLTATRLQSGGGGQQVPSRCVCPIGRHTPVPAFEKTAAKNAQREKPKSIKVSDGCRPSLLHSAGSNISRRKEDLDSIVCRVPPSHPSSSFFFPFPVQISRGSRKRKRDAVRKISCVWCV